MKKKTENISDNKYLLIIEKLKLGDIVLSSGHSIGSKAIMVGTNSKYSHVMLYVDRSLIHAVPEGIFTTNPQRELFDNRDDLKVLRPKGKISQHTIENICLYARGQVGSLYSIKEALRTKLLKNSSKPAKTKKQFCSRLVAQAYGAAGIELTSNPDYCSPQDLLDSKLLREVGGVVKIASKEDIEFSKTENRPLKNFISTYKFLRATRELAACAHFALNTQNDVADFLIKHPEYDIEVCKYFEESGYLDAYKDEKETNPYRYNKDEFLLKFKKLNVPIAEAIIIEFSKEPSVIKNHYQNLCVFNDLYNVHQLKYFKLNVELHQNILKDIKCRIQIIEEVAKEKQLEELFQELSNNLPML